ncbi:MAG: DNA repair protein RadC [Myxococcales bacterium]|nr:DNA repair protein RadC [Myxococcales bacterium]
MMFGAASLSDAELVAALLGTGSRGRGVLELAAHLLGQHGGLVGLVRASPSEVASTLGIGTTKAARLAAAAELGFRAFREPPSRGMAIRSSIDIDRAFRSRLAALDHEEVLVLGVDAKNRLSGVHTVGVGGVAECAVLPADVFRPLLRHGASGLVLLHNHPSGDPSPSPEDARFTERVAQASALVGLRFLDHVVIAAEGYYSFRDQALLPEEKTP